MVLKTEKAGNICIVNISGRLDTTNFRQLEDVLGEQISNDEKNIIVDCSEMEYVSSSGLRIFLMMLKKIDAKQGKFIISNLQAHIFEIFEIAGFTSIFKITKNIDEAKALIQ